jgi:hypothetical protein
MLGCLKFQCHCEWWDHGVGQGVTLVPPEMVVARSAVWRYPPHRPRDTGDAPAAYSRDQCWRPVMLKVRALGIGLSLAAGNPLSASNLGSEGPYRAGDDGARELLAVLRTLGPHGSVRHRAELYPIVMLASGTLGTP